MHRIRWAASAVVFVVGFAVSVAAQTVTQTDIQRLQEDTAQAVTDVSQLRSRDATRANQLQVELDDLRDEVTYLKVKLRKERSVARTEYLDVRDRIENLRARASGETARSTSAPATSQPATRATTTSTTPAPATTTLARGEVEIPTGTEMDVRLSDALNSGTAKVEDRFEATTLVDLTCRRTIGGAGRVGDARCRHGGGAGDAHEPDGKVDRQLRSGHGERTCVPDSRNSESGARRGRHQG